MYAGLGAKVVVNDMSKDAAATVVDEITRCEQVYFFLKLGMS